MKRTTLLIATGLAAVAAIAQARPQTPDPMAGFYGNTLTIDVVGGYYSAERFIDPDGTWRETSRELLSGASAAKGVWRIENGQVCSWQTEPAAPDARHYCYPAVAHKLGETWSTTDPDSGREVVQRIRPGRSGQP